MTKAIKVLAGVLMSVSAMFPINTSAQVQRPIFATATIQSSHDATGAGVHVHRNGVTIKHQTLRDLVAYAYGINDASLLQGGPWWIDSHYFDITATTGGSPASHSDPAASLKLMLQDLVGKQFQLKLTTTQVNEALVLTPVKPAKFQLAKLSDENFDLTTGHLVADGLTMNRLASVLSDQPEAQQMPVINRTGLAGYYKLALDWTSQSIPGNGSASKDSTGLFRALEGQLGLQLTPIKGPLNITEIRSASLPEQI